MTSYNKVINMAVASSCKFLFLTQTQNSKNLIHESTEDGADDLYGRVGSET